MNNEFLRRDFLGKEADIPNTRLADFVQDPLDAAISCASIGTDINLPIRSILNALSDPIRQFVHCDHSIAIKNPAVPPNANDLRVFCYSLGIALAYRLRGSSGPELWRGVIPGTIIKMTSSARLTPTKG